jgi:hypothetical protein
MSIILYNLITNYDLLSYLCSISCLHYDTKACFYGWLVYVFNLSILQCEHYLIYFLLIIIMSYSSYIPKLKMKYKQKESEHIIKLS